MTALTKDVIVKLLETNDRAIAHALVVLHNNQTKDEQRTETTRNRNGEGFRPCHAKMGSSMATFYLARNFLSAKQCAYWRKKMACGNSRISIYWRQLAIAAEKKSKQIEIQTP